MSVLKSLIEPSEELFNSSLSHISYKEDEAESDESLSDYSSFINTLNKLEKEEKSITEFDYLNHKNDRKDVTENIQTIVFKPTNTSEYTQPKLKTEENEEDLKDFFKSLENLENNIIKSLGYEGKISLRKLNIFLKNNTLEEIEHKTLEKILIEICPKNAEIISYSKQLEKLKGKTAFGKINRLTFKEMYDYYICDCKIIISGKHLYNLTGKFRTLNDVLNQKIKMLERRILKLAPKGINIIEHEEKPMEIEDEVSSIFIALK